MDFTEKRENRLFSKTCENKPKKASLASPISFLSQIWKTFQPKKTIYLYAKQEKKEIIKSLRGFYDGLAFSSPGLSASPLVPPPPYYYSGGASFPLTHRSTPLLVDIDLHFK